MQGKLVNAGGEVERAKIREILKKLADSPRSFLPDAREPLDILIFGILSARSPHKLYQQAFAHLKKHAWAEVDEKMSEQDVVDLIQPLFPAVPKAARVKAALKRVKQDFGDYTLKPLAGCPEEEIMSYLISFAGVGLKVASMVAAYGFDLPWLPIDVHVERILKYCGVLKSAIKLDKAHHFIRSLDLQPSEVKDLFVLLQEHGRRVCTARRSKCDLCEIKENCLKDSQVTR